MAESRRWKNSSRLRRQVGDWYAWCTPLRLREQVKTGIETHPEPRAEDEIFEVQVPMETNGRVQEFYREEDHPPRARSRLVLVRYGTGRPLVGRCAPHPGVTG